MTFARHAIAATAFAAFATLPIAAHAQSAVVVEEHSTVGGPSYMLPSEQLPRFREYVVQESVPSYVIDEPVEVGSVLPEVGVTFYDVPQRFGTTPYRYTVVNDRTVLVNPRTRRIMQVVD